MNFESLLNEGEINLSDLLAEIEQAILDQLPAYPNPAEAADIARRIFIEHAGSLSTMLTGSMLDAWVNSFSQRSPVLGSEVEFARTGFEAAAQTIMGVYQQELARRVANLVESNIRDGGTLADFLAQTSSDLIPSDAETIYRTNVSAAYSWGEERAMAIPGMRALFPYTIYSSTHDGRTRPEHMAMETLGLNGTAVYRTDDPVWEEFRPPWAWSCRCRAIPLSLRDAAARGVAEARVWLDRGRPPEIPEWVPHPPFSADPRFAQEKNRFKAII